MSRWRSKPWRGFVGLWLLIPASTWAGGPASGDTGTPLGASPPRPAVTAAVASPPGASCVDGPRQGGAESMLPADLREVDRAVALYNRCPSAANHLRAARAQEAVGRRDKSIVYLEAAAEAYSSLAASAAGAGDRQELASRAASLRGLVSGMRAQPLRREARERAGFREYAEAERLYEQYLQAAPEAADRDEVEKEREWTRERRRADDWRWAQRRRRGVGFATLGAGVVVAAVGAGVMAAGFILGGSAPEAADLTLHSERLGTARSEVIAGGLLCGVGGAALIGGMTRLLVGRGQEPRPTVWLAPTAGGLAAGGTF